MSTLIDAKGLVIINSSCRQICHYFEQKLKINALKSDFIRIKFKVI
ncbi:hypothetical protein GPAL_3702 [Glaciecola pallidula DSM 14239 = ACAM 615]|uniref:Uncharacterized protein n=1 Tax=Brumicola pallidula DSM 14239 = ACAM 615 TaxID=1121922 RepID=K6ZNT0_9ALTE|nr:hypothetical protein GPAL_3702 [Glaciecola pallidula DSM 14239 = ACAM 615]